MLQKPTYLDSLKINYRIDVILKPKVNGNFLLSIKLYVGDPNSYYYITQNLLKLFLDNWSHYFFSKGVTLMRRRNGAVYLDKISQDFINQLEHIGFFRYRSRFRSRKSNTEFRKDGRNIKDIDHILYKLFKYDAFAQQPLMIEDLLEQN